jgi:hypothetical protein
MSEPQYEEIRKRITTRYENRMQYIAHMIPYLAINALIWSGALGGWQMLDWISAAWSLGFAISTIRFLMTEARERAIDRAIQEEREWQTGNMEKPKRDPHMRLTEDGEIEAVEDDDSLPYEEPRKRLTR